MEQIERFCFCSDNKRTKSKRFGFVPIISFDIVTFVLSFQSTFPQQAERKKERICKQPCPLLNTSTPCITDTESRQLPALVIRGVVDSTYRWYGKSIFERKKICLVPFSRKKERKNKQTNPPSSKYLLKNSPYISGSVDSLHHWYRESSTPRIGDTGSLRLRISLIRGVNISEKKKLV